MIRTYTGPKNFALDFKFFFLNFLLTFEREFEKGIDGTLDLFPLYHQKAILCHQLFQQRPDQETTLTRDILNIQLPLTPIPGIRTIFRRVKG